MKLLKELVLILSRNKIKYYKLYQHISHNKKLGKLYDGVEQEQFDTDLEAANAIYKETEISQKYRNLKNRLFQTLLNFVFFVTTTDKNNYQKAYIDCYKNLALIKILIGLSARQTALFLAIKTLKEAVKYEFFELIVILTSDLKYHFSTIDCQPKKYEEYHALFLKYKTILDVEIEIQNTYQQLAIYCNTRKEKEAQNEANIITRTNEIISQYPYQKISLFGFLVLCIYHELNKNYSKAISTAYEALAFFEQKKYVNRTTQYTFFIKILTCHILIRNYENGVEIVQKCLGLQPEGSGNWFMSLEYHLILAFHTQNYQKAYETFIKVQQHKRYKQLPSYTKERWYLYKAYLFFLINKGLVEHVAATDFGTFRINKFLNEINYLNKDKTGMNVSVICITVLFLIQKKKYNQLIDKLDSIKVYQYRYLNKRNSMRSFLFLKLLLLITKIKFNPRVLNIKSKKIFKELQQTSASISIEETEIILYETQWEMILKMLGDTP